MRHATPYVAHPLPAIPAPRRRRIAARATFLYTPPAGERAYDTTLVRRLGGVVSSGCIHLFEPPGPYSVAGHPGRNSDEALAVRLGVLFEPGKET